MKKIIFILLLICVPVFSFGGVSNTLLKNVANKINKSCPKMVDNETRLEKTIGFDNTLTYIYTLVNYKASQLNADKLKRKFKPSLIKKVCGLKSTAIIFKNGITVNYSYFTKDNQFLFNIKLPPDTCQQFD